MKLVLHIMTRCGDFWKCEPILSKANGSREMNYCSSLCYRYSWKISIFFKNKFISLELFDFEKYALYFQKSPNLTILGQSSNWIKFPFFHHLQPLRKCHFISRHPLWLQNLQNNIWYATWHHWKGPFLNTVLIILKSNKVW